MLEILTQESEVADGRRQLEEWGASLYPSRPRRLWFRVRRKLGVPGRPVWPDWLKSWDVAKTVGFIRERVGSAERVLDLGCVNSEVLWSLARIGYRNLAGCDLDPRCVEAPFSDVVHYSVQDLMHTSYPSFSCRAISCISVIEHGVDLDAFLAEARRLLQPGGFLLVSTDYWPSGIDTSNVKAFGLPWRIFSRAELEEFLAKCQGFSLDPLGPINWREPRPVVSWQDRRYSFAWIALQAR